MTISDFPNNRDLVIHSTRYLDMGACYDGGMFLRCAMIPEECQITKGESFSAHVQSSFIMNICNPNDYKIGRCITEGTCALRSSDCAEDTSQANFRNKDDYCTHQRDKAIAWNVDAPAYTQFGSCKNLETNDYFCIYDPDECVASNNEVYATPAQTKAAGFDCDCSEVHVTACKTESDRVMCAVNKAACNQSYMYKMTPHTQRVDRESGVDNLDCRLCRKSNTVKPTPSPTKFGASDNVLKTTTKMPTPAPAIMNIPDNSKTNNKSNTPIIVGASAGGAVVLLVLVFAFVKMGIFKKGGKEFDTTTVDTGPANLEIAF